MAEGEKVDERPILVPVDFSEHSRQALVLAARFARCDQAPIVVLHVVNDPGHAPGYYLKSGPKTNLRRIEDAAAEMMSDFLKQTASGCPELGAPEDLRTMLVVGLPASRILEVADQLKARMIVMGSHGRTGLAHLMLGSKAERVVQLAKVPVTIFKS
jgi:nucleotide-binding universal stress UspA family protein